MAATMQRIGDLLVAAGFVSEAQLEAALLAQKQSGRRLGEELIAQGVVTEVQLTQTLSNQLSVPWVSLYHVEFSRELLAAVPAELAAEFGAIPIYRRRLRQGETLFVAMDDPTNGVAIEALERIAGLPIKAMVAPPSEIARAIEAYYGIPSRLQPAPPATASVIPEAPQIQGGLPSVPPPAAIPSETADVDENVSSEADAQVPPPKSGGSFVTFTLLDGSTVRLPAPAAAAEPESKGHALTASDLVAALLARSQGADVGNVLPPDESWETLFATLLSLLIKKGLVADWEFVEAWKQHRGQ